MKHIWLFLVVAGILSACNSTSQDNSKIIHVIQDKEVAYPRLSADQQQILYQSNEHGPWSLHIMDRQTNTHSTVLADAYNNNFPDWSYDHQWIAFTSDRDGNEEIYLMRSDGSEMKRLTDHPGRDIHPYFSPDGKYLMFNSTRHNGSFDIYRYELATGALRQFSNTHENETCARYSTDMRHLVYLQNGATSDDIIVADSNNTTQVNITKTPAINDGWPVFAYDNQWVYYSSMESGSYCVYRARLDGSEKTQLTRSRNNEEDARVSPSRDGKYMVFNRRHGATIEIRGMDL